jgi:hypothetical protein
MPGSGDEGTKTMAMPFLVHFPYVLSFGLLFSLFLCLLCSLFWSHVLSVSLLAMFSLLVFFAPSVPAFSFVCSVSSGILLSSLYLCFHSFSFVSIFSSGSFCVCFFFVFRLSVCPLGFLVLCFFFFFAFSWNALFLEQ